jgi:preprotein translocase subunit SecG
MIYVLVPIYIIVCVFLILVVLLQQGKGADVASAFGASSSQTTFGARGATTVLEKVTTWSFVAFSVLAVAISLLQARPKSSVLQQLGTQPPAKSAPAVPAVPAPANAVPVAPAAETGAPAAVPATDVPAPATAAPAPAGPAQK